MTRSQQDRILSHLSTGATLTPLQALRKFGTLRLGARIYELRKRVRIHGEIVVVNGKRVARYWM